MPVRKMSTDVRHLRGGVAKGRELRIAGRRIADEQQSPVRSQRDDGAFNNRRVAEPFLLNFAIQLIRGHTAQDKSPYPARSQPPIGRALAGIGCYEID